MGKSRLVTEVTTIAAGQGFTVLCGQCAEIGDSVPYLPFADAIRTASADVEAAVKARPVLARLLPDGGAGGDPETDRAGLTRQQMFGTVLGLLAELSAHGPVLLVLEDLHWADASTRDLLTFLLRMLHGERIAIIGTYRTDDLYRRHPLRPVVADLLRLPSVTSVQLGPLSPSALTELLFSISDAPGRLSAATVNQIVASAEGNAYYAEELLAALSDTADGNRDGLGLPSGLAALLMSRVERVSDAAQQVLRAAAVAGRRSGDDLVRAASGLPDAAYDEAVREAVANQLLVPDGADGYAFRHALLREAVYSDLLPGERTRLHGQLAALLSGVPGAAAELAHHSLASHDVPGAFAASIRAGNEARRLGAPTEARRHYDQALSLWDRVDDAAAIAGVSRGRLGLQSAAAAFAAGDVPRAVHLLRRIWQALADPRAGVTAGDADPELRSQIGERLAYFLLETRGHRGAGRGAAGGGRHRAGDPGRAADLVPGPRDGNLRDGLHGHRGRRVGPGVGGAGARRRRRRGALGGGGGAGHAGPAEQPRGRHRRGQPDVRRRRGAGRGNADVPGRAAGHLLARPESTRSGASSPRRRGSRSWASAERTPTGSASRPTAWTCATCTSRRASSRRVGPCPASWPTASRSGSPVLPEAVLSAMALFIDVARGNPAVEERRTWLEPFWGDGFVGYLARSLLAEHALWGGDTELALAHAEAAIRSDLWRSDNPSVLRPAAVALAARADRAVAARLAGNADAEAAEVAGAKELLDIAREGARYPARPKAVLGPEGRGWLARAEAEYRRASGHNSPEAWEAVLGRVRPAVRLRDRPRPVAAGRGAHRGGPDRGGGADLARSRRDRRAAGRRTALRRP